MKVYVVTETWRDGDVVHQGIYKDKKDADYCYNLLKEVASNFKDKAFVVIKEFEL